ncbi:methylamine utilization protein [Leptospira interrogans serovar Hardjo]
MLIRFLVVFISLVFWNGNVSAAEHEVGQKNKGFTVESLKIKVGDVVSFPNYDTFYHNVYSLSPAKIFDYSQGKTQKVKFEKSGKITVQCAIHPEMKMTIEVQ